MTQISVTAVTNTEEFNVTAETTVVRVTVTLSPEEQAKVYALQAQASAAEALASELAAAASELAAAASASNAFTSQQAAGQSASNALGSADAATAQAVIATDKATLATQKADLATTKASESSQSASDALASENAASAFAQTASTQAGIATDKATLTTTKANEASNSASNALASEQSAESSKQTAITQAGIATTKANEASQSASDALASKNAALVSQNAAAESASTATTQAGISTTQAGIATTQAGISTTKAAESLVSANASAASAASADSIINQGVYGVQWDVTLATTVMTRIGDMAMHNALTGHPVQNRMRRCLLLDDGTVNYYLDPNNSTKKLDGSASVLNGADGQVMVEIPEHWRRFDTDGNIRRVLIAEAPFRGSHRVPLYYVSAYEAALQRSNSRLSSVINLTTDFRGGNNNAAWDAEERTLLGMPATVISRINFLAFARNRGTNWHSYLYEIHKIIFWLFTIEYATRNSQLAFNAALDANNYRQGGLGNGVTNIGSTAWNNFNSYSPFIACGAGAATNFTAQKPLTHATLGATNIPQYRGIEHPFGHIWKWTEGVNFRAGNSRNMVYKANSLNFQSANYNGYTYVTDMATANNFIRELNIGPRGDIFPTNTSGSSSTTFWSDYFFQSIPASGESLRGLLVGGSAYDGSIAGFVSSSTVDPSNTSTNIGSRLCFARELGA